MLKRKSAVARKRVIDGQVRTNVVIDRDLVEKAKAKAHVRTIREAVNAALAEFVKPYDYSGLLALRGTSCIAEDYDPGAGGAPKFLGWDRVHEPLTPPEAPGRKRIRIVQRRSVK